MGVRGGSHVVGGRRVPGPCGGARVAAWGPGDGQCGSLGSRVRHNLRADHSDEMQLYFFKCEVSG